MVIILVGKKKIVPFFSFVKIGTVQLAGIDTYN